MQIIFRGRHAANAAPRQRGPAIRGKKRQGNGATRNGSHALPHNPSALIFCDKCTGVPRFRVEVKGDEPAAIERSATLLALACSMSGNSPADYAIHVPAHDDLICGVTRKTEELLRLGRGLFSAVTLSPRENEVLGQLLRNRINKEIAAHLRISVRTVKFHVSSLLLKFGVQSRWDLVQKASQILGSDSFREPPQPAASASDRDASRAAAKKPAAEAKPWRARAGGHVIPFRRAATPA